MRREFAAKYEDWRSAPFPPGGSSDDANEVHADLVVVDTWIADLVMPFVKEGRLVEQKVDIRAAVDRLLTQCQQLARSDRGEDQILAREYVCYLNRLRALYGVYLQLGSKTTSNPNESGA